MRPPAEHLGQARALRWKIAAADELVEPIVATTVSRLQDRARRLPRSPQRRDTLTDLERLWRASMPPLGHIGVSISIKDRFAPAFRVMRISSVRFSCTLWDGNDSDGVAVTLVTVRARHGVVSVEPHVLAGVSLHGLARRFQRGREQTDDAVLRDVATLGWAWPQLIDDGGDRFALNVADGAWAGSLAKMDGFVSCLAQTWLHEGAGASLPVLTGDIDALAESLPGLEVTA